MCVTGQRGIGKTRVCDVCHSGSSFARGFFLLCLVLNIINSFLPSWRRWKVSSMYKYDEMFFTRSNYDEKTTKLNMYVLFIKMISKKFYGHVFHIFLSMLGSHL